MGQLLLFFCANSAAFLAYIGGLPVTNLFSLLLIDKVYLGYSAN